MTRALDQKHKHVGLSGPLFLLYYCYYYLILHNLFSKLFLGGKANTFANGGGLPPNLPPVRGGLRPPSTPCFFVPTSWCGVFVLACTRAAVRPPPSACPPARPDQRPIHTTAVLRGKVAQRPMNCAKVGFCVKRSSLVVLRGVL